tara:strand:+ start:247 stop:921 length:675 start_codon:yes stop_codon:yes gene_type:complete
MDGNGRWAKSKKLPRAIGHKNGVKSVQVISELCSKLKVEYLTLYTLSLENFSRPQLELKSLMALLSSTIKSEISKMKENNIKFNIIGFRDKLPQKINAQLDFAISETKNNDGLKLNLALAYGARSELIHAISLLIDQLTNDNLKIDDINEEIISQNLFTKDIPDPDLLIRTGGENRLSNFLLWQSAYTELYFSNKFWPDFNKEDLYEALHDYERRDRRFGRVNL